MNKLAHHTQQQDRTLAANQLNGIRARLIGGFGLIVLLFFFSIGFSPYSHNHIKAVATSTITRDLPSMGTTNDLLAEVRASIIALRAWMITDDPKYKKD